MKLRDVALDDKYTLEKGQIFVSGIQALVRLPMLQSQKDRTYGLNTAGFVTGYRGSPLGGLDQQLLLAQEHLILVLTIRILIIQEVDVTNAIAIRIDRPTIEE